MFATALVAIDMSDARLAVLDCIPQLEAWGVRRIVLVHVLDKGLPPNPQWGQRQYVEQDLRELAERLRPRMPGVDIDTEVLEARAPAEGLLDLGDKHSVDLIVIGSRSHSLTDSLFLGNFARDVIRKTTRPTLLLALVPGTEPRAPMHAVCEDMLRRVLLATDFSRRATPAETAAHLLAERHVPIDCLHVIQTQSRLAMPLWPTMAKAALHELGAGLRKVGSPASEALLAEGEPAEQIALTARTHDHSLILVGKHGQNWIEGRLIGSTAARICEIAGRPVLVMP